MTMILKKHLKYLYIFFAFLLGSFASLAQGKFDFFLNEGELYNNPLYVASKQLLISTPSIGEMEASRITIWDLKTESVLMNIFYGNNNSVDVELSPTEKYLVFKFKDSTRVLDLNTINWVFAYQNDSLVFFNQSFHRPHFFREDSVFLYASNGTLYYTNTNDWLAVKRFESAFNINFSSVPIKLYFANNAIGFYNDYRLKVIDVPSGIISKEKDFGSLLEGDFKWGKILPFDNFNQALVYCESNDGKSKMAAFDLNRSSLSNTIFLSSFIEELNSESVLPPGNCFLALEKRSYIENKRYIEGYACFKIDFENDSLYAKEYHFQDVHKLTNYSEGMLKFNKYSAALIDNEANSINTINFRTSKSISFKLNGDYYLGQITLLDSNLVAYSSDATFGSKARYKLFNTITGYERSIEARPFTIQGVSPGNSCNIILRNNPGKYELSKVQDDFSIIQLAQLNTRVKKIAINLLKFSTKTIWMQLQEESNAPHSFTSIFSGKPQITNALQLELSSATATASYIPQQSLDSLASGDCSLSFTYKKDVLWKQVDSVFIRDTQTDTLIASAELTSISTSIFDLRFYRNATQDKLLYTDSRGFGMLNLTNRTLSKLYHVPTSLSGLRTISFCNDDKNICVYDRGQINVYDAANGDLIFDSSNKVDEAQNLIPSRKSSRFLAEFSRKIELRDFNSHSFVKTLELKNKKWAFNGIRAGMGTNLFYTYESTGILSIYTLDKAKLIFERNIGTNAGFNGEFLGDTAMLYFDLVGNPTVWNFASNSVRKFMGFCKMGEILSHRFYPQNNLLISIAYNNVYFWNYRKGILEARFIVGDTTDFLMIDRNGYYSGSKSMYPKIRARYKNKVFSVGQLDVLNNRPDKVIQTLGDAFGFADTTLVNNYKNAWQKRIKNLGLNATRFDENLTIPVADFSNRNAIRTEQSSEDGKLELSIRCIDTASILDRYNVWINNVPAFGQKGISVREDSINSIEKHVLVNLSVGQNKIETSVLNAYGIESYRIPLFVNYTAPIKAEEKLYFVGLGIDKYIQPGHNLNYSVKDIRDLTAALKEKYGNKLIIDTLFDQQVTREKILSLKKKLLNTGVNDKVIVSFSGHGLLDKNFDYYLATHTVDFKNPAKDGLPYEDLEWLLDSIPARKKLLLLDACHSGEVDKDELIAMNNTKPEGTKGLELVYDYKPTLGMKNSFELMQELFANVNRGTGATVISAAGGTQFAREDGELKNGVFTFSILELMKKQPEISVSELKTKVGNRVIELTNGLQKPTSRSENIEFDWRVW